MSTPSPISQGSSSAHTTGGQSSNQDANQLQEPARVYDIYSWSNKSPSTRLVYIQNVDAANQAIAQLNTKVLGFDLEWKPNFVKGRPENPVALVQLASAELILLIHVSYMHTFPEKLRELLADESIVKAGVGIQKDCKKLYEDHGVDTRNCVDLSLLARTVDNPRWKGKYASPIGLSRLCEAYEELTLQKGRVQTSNWEQPLDLRQQQYAANDCHAGLVLYLRLVRMATAMDPVPQRVWYTFDVINGYLYQPSSGTLWHPFNPYYDPGPPPPPRPPRVNDGTNPNGPQEPFRGGRFPRRGRQRHPQARPLSPSATAFVPGAHAHTPSPSPSPVAGFAPPRSAGEMSSHSYTRSPAPRYPSPSAAPAGIPMMDVDEDGFPRMGRVPRAYQGKPRAYGDGGSGFGAHPNAGSDAGRGRGQGRGRGRGRGQSQPVVRLGYFSIVG